MRADAAFDELNVGDAFETAGRVIGEEDVAAFARLTGDHHPLHTDAEWAAQSALGERVAHGMLVLSYAVGLAEFAPQRVLALRGLRDVVFKRPVKLGDTITLTGEIRELKAVSDAAGLVTYGWSITEQRHRLCVRAVVEVLWMREPAQVPLG